MTKTNIENLSSAKNDTGVVKEVEKIKRNTRIEKSPVSRTFKYLFKNREKLRFDLAIQRNEVWTHEQKSMLIHSILYGFPVPPVMMKESDDDFYWFLDGKQRLTSVINFMQGNFALNKNTPDVFGIKIANNKFADLSEDMREMIEDETIQLIRLKNMTDEERDEIFVRWNSGTSLSKIELTRAMHSGLIEQINHVAELEFFAEDIALSNKARNRFQDQEIILQIAMLMHEGRDNIKGFGSTHVKDYVLQLKQVGEVLPDDLIRTFEATSHYLNMALSDFDITERKKALKKIHIPMIFYVTQEAISLKVKPNIFGKFIKDFLITNYTIESDYGRACQSGSAKKENVQVRLHEMSEFFEDYLDSLAEEDKAHDKVKNKRSGVTTDATVITKEEKKEASDENTDEPKDKIEA